ncbi:hypothetical protein [Spongiactinospora sp. TRM90649]|uniref:hypothetical protein n=1 Tax=Spongiactinospora sp. TRM90649 TaxID=3031114 RepID=UPI0023F842EA|nr:hypothetical protein [Spongiactinospora sp. TRM90649]MDF5753210.1 hypothetical protein [Spongiactinospora sp. TRM90649]
MSTDDPQARLREIDEDLAKLKDAMGGPVDYPQDAGDQASDLTRREELNAEIEALKRERDRIRRGLE